MKRRKFLKIDKEKIKEILSTNYDLTFEEYKVLSQAFRKGYVTFETARKYKLVRFGILENKGFIQVAKQKIEFDASDFVKELLQEYEKEVNNDASKV